MAKSKKSKILAMALCASVMTGIYASPVLAGTIDVNTENGGLNVTINSNGNFPNDGIYLDRTNPDDLKITGMFSVSADQLAMAIKGTDIDVSSVTANGVITDKISSKSGGFIEVGPVRIQRGSWIGQSYFGNDVSLMDGNVTFKGLVNSDDKGAYITLKGHEGKTAELSYKQLANINGTIQDGNVVTAKELTVNGASGGLYVRDVDDGKTMIYTKAADADGTNTVWIDPENGNISTIGTIGVGFANGLNNQPTTILDKTGDINVGISYNADGSVAGQKINLDAETGNITLADKATVDGVDVSELADNTAGIVRLGETTTIENTVSVDKWGLKVLDENGKTVADINSTTGGINAAKGKFHVWSDGAIEGTALSLKNNGAQNVYIGNSGTARFGAEDGNNVRIENGVLYVYRNNEQLAALGENGLTLTSSNNIRATLDAEQIANLNSTIKEGGVVDAKELNVTGAAGGLYVKDVSNDDVVTGTMIYTKAADGKTNTMWIDPNTGNLSTVGTIGVGFANGLNNQPTTILDKTGDINVGISYNADGSVAGQKINLDAETGNITLADKATVDGVDVSELEGKFNTTNANVGGITRTDVTDGVGTTTIEGDFAVNGKDNTFGSKNGSFTVNAEDGTFTAANGAFKVREGVGETVIAGSIISSKDQFGNQGTFNGSNLNLQSADHTRNTSIDAGTAYFVKNGSGTSIDGGAITAKTLNGKVIDDLVEGSDIADDLANIGGISRQQDENGVFYTNIEGTLTVSEKGLKAEKNGHAIDVNEDGAFLSSGTAAVYASNNTVGLMADANNYISITNNGIGLKGNVVFDTENYGPYSLSGLVDKVEDIYNRTQGIDYDSSTGTTTIDGNLDVKGDTETGAGGNENVNGSLTVGDTEGSQTIIEDDNITTGIVDANEGNFTDKVTVGEAGDQTVIDGGTITTGNTTIDGSGMTVGNGTTITDGKVSSTEGAFGNITSNTGTIGNATFDENGMTVGGSDGVSIKNDEVRVGGGEDGKGGSYMNENDVVTGEGNSLNDTANRVGNLEQGVSELNNRVGELEDRIDKVGAMAAAIANLRTMGYDPAAPTEVAVGIGQYRDETGAALGLFHYPNRDFMLSLSVSTSGDEVMGGIGATWKFGRKSPEKVAEIKKAQAEADARRAEEAKLAKAEEMKQAAKEAKIKAQQERHAKLAAERAAQAEAAK